MFDKNDSAVYPDAEQMSSYIHNHLWTDFCDYMKEVYQSEPSFEFSKCSWEYGWNAKFKKKSKSLCTVYPRETYFTVMIVIGANQKEQFDDLLPSLCPAIKRTYAKTKDKNGFCWLMIDLEDNDDAYADVKALLELRV